MLQASRFDGSIRNIVRPVLVSLILFSVSVFATYFRTSAAPDIFMDEILYSRIGVRVAGEGALVWDSGNPFLVHPPLYFIAAGIFQGFTGSPNTPLFAPGDIFNTVYHMRILNALFAGATTLILYWFGWSLRREGLGLLYAALFILDPFGMRINRRAMLETLAMLLVTASMWVYWLDIKQSAARRAPPVSALSILAGLLLGAAFLTKELVMTFSLIFTLFAAWELWRSRLWKKITALFKQLGKDKDLSTTDRSAIWLATRTAAVISIAFMTYGLYLSWIFSTGVAPEFTREKSLGVLRLIGLVQITGWNRPGISLIDLLLERLNLYGTSYLLLALGGLSLVGTFVWLRVLMASRLMIVTGAILYPFFAFVALFGSGNDHFFYYLLVPAVLLFGYGVSYIIMPDPRRVHGQGDTGRSKVLMRSISAALVVGIISYNGISWWQNYAIGSDNGYTQFVDFVEENIPQGEQINASGDPIKFRYFLPDYETVPAATPDEAVAAGVHYFALAPKDLLMHFGRIKPELAAWIRDQGTLLFTVTGNTYGDIYLYRVDYEDPGGAETPPVTQHQLQGSLFQTAKGSFISGLTLRMGIWITIWFILAAGLAWRERSRNEVHWIRRTLYQ